MKGYISGNIGGLKDMVEDDLMRRLIAMASVCKYGPTMADNKLPYKGCNGQPVCSSIALRLINGSAGSEYRRPNNCFRFLGSQYQTQNKEIKSLFSKL